VTSLRLGLPPLQLAPNLTSAAFSSGLDAGDYLTNSVQLIVPGDKETIPFAGIFIGPSEVQR
jgi:hypothetical protein